MRLFHAACGPDMILFHIHILSFVKGQILRPTYGTVEDLHKAVRQRFRLAEPDFYFKGIFKLKERMGKLGVIKQKLYWKNEQK